MKAGWFFFLSVWLFLTFPVSVGAQEEEIRITNTSRYVGAGRYDWTVYIDASPSTLARIRCVEYILHPTFPNPVRKVCSMETRFALSSNGWGEFTIRLNIHYQDGRVVHREYWLKLGRR